MRREPATQNRGFPSSILMLDILVSKKAVISICSTDAGTRSGVRDEQYKNAESSIRSNFDPDSKETPERHLQSSKHCIQRISTEEGMQIDLNESQFANVLLPRVLSLECNSKGASSIPLCLNTPA
jgi:hypothetical protein